MSYEIQTAVIKIDGVWWLFTGMDSFLWTVHWSEKKKRPYLWLDTGDVIYGERIAQVTLG